jgi:hypothetical protein
MKVKELREHLKEQDQEMLVAYVMYSEQCLLTAEDMKVVELCKARPDGWVQYKRDDMTTDKYLLLGN